jgi:predicted NAD-dependent protein-ADP-ribosyltransferase YbiA (DUF1768 family)
MKNILQEHAPLRFLTLPSNDEVVVEDDEHDFVWRFKKDEDITARKNSNV